MVNRLLSSPFALENRLSQLQVRRRGVLAVVAWLQARPGETWQERWRASGAETAADWRSLVDPSDGRARPSVTRPLGHLAPGLLVMICGDVIRPSLAFVLASAGTRRNLAPEMARTRDPKGFAALARSVDAADVGLQATQQALTRVACILAAKGGLVCDVTVGDCVELLELARQMRGEDEGRAGSPLFYQLLRATGALGDDAPATLRVFSGRGRPGPAQLIDRYQIACRPVRDVLVDYLAERQASADFSSLQRFAYLLGKLFWADLEAHHPGIDSLKLPREVAAAWTERVMTKTRGGQTTARLDGRNVLERGARLLPRYRRVGRGRPSTVGTLRLPLPGQRERRLPQEGPPATQVPDGPTHARTPPGAARSRPLRRARTAPEAELLAAAEATTPGELFSAAGETLRHPVLKTKTTGRIWSEDPKSGRRRDLTFEEHRAFWTWAMVEVLRHTGIRIEELTELSHHSLIQYRLPANGELVPLLQIAPSKTDTERLLVVSPELADVLATIVGRIRDDEGRVPLVVSHDKNERVYNAPMPLLFQCRRRLEDHPVSETALRGYLDHALEKIGVIGPDGRTLRYTFHDFRRMFITDAILHGMPPHIAQLVAGHRDINTTMGYKAVYPEEVISGHRAFINRRRALRPSEEYRMPTDEEWEEFLGHFARRKVALGECGRSYATPCIHEHSCLRCPLLRPDPVERSRLVEIRDNLLERIDEAESNGWLGEAEGLRVSLDGARRETRPDGSHRRAAHQLGQPRHAHVRRSRAHDDRRQRGRPQSLLNLTDEPLRAGLA